MMCKDNYVMIKRATPKLINLPNGRSFVAIYERVPRDRLPPNVTLKRRYKQRPAPKSKRRWQAGKCIFIFIKKVPKSPAINALGKAALKKALALLDNISKRTKNITLKSRL